jgi:PAS domain S-box-containing protein
LVLESRLRVFPATLLFVFQLGVLIAAIAICHSGASRSRVPLVVLAAFVLIAMSSSGMFAAIGGHGEMLGFVLLTLYLAASPLFAWNGRAALVLIVGTLVPWVLALLFVSFVLRPAELALALSFAAMVSLTTLVVARRNFRVAQQAMESSERYRDLADGAPDMIFSVDLAGRYTYVNDALARFVGVVGATLIGRSGYDFLTDNPGNPDLRAVVERLAGGDEVPPQIYEIRSVKGPRWIETAFSAITAVDGRVVRLRGSARDVTQRLADERELRASLEALRESEEDLRAVLVEHQSAVEVRADAADIIGFDVKGPGSDERASIALLRKPLATLKDEEVRDLKEEVDRLRNDVQKHQADMESRVAALVDEGQSRPRRGRPRKLLPGA